MFATRTIVPVLLIAAIWASWAQAEEVVGIQSERPASGPFVKIEQGYMVPYEIAVPNSTVKLRMIPIPGGTVKLGSPESEAGHTAAEAPEVTVTIDPFWMAETETTWGQYYPFMAMYDIFKKFDREGIRGVTDTNRVHAVTIPTPLHEPGFTYKYGENPQLPAVTMTNYAARQYTKWLRGVTGQQIRLPSEAEWEYAAAGGATTAYHFGNEPEKLAEYGWFVDNSEERPHFVKEKKPNSFGLYDMHGNVWEWVLDQYDEEGYQRLAGKTVSSEQSVNWPTEVESMMLKGGGWDDKAIDCRLASKMESSEEDWKGEDPNNPLSPWWYTDLISTGVGFRIVRPLKEDISLDVVTKFYDPVIEDLEFDVNFRLDDGRAALGLADPKLPAAIEQVK
ncbi:formylglycine-generating enzyme family protein [Blastopirellula marina]|uniref:Transcriptional regulator n=1 Tax=Blastopirellula marina TaxID=124 RepID=A0A2S8F490_9BACT|nr:formylglycine-generating enzyme family protein [Blastopirellula marina]PQO26985.1 transcriptional regulator [Blastopirellula marina]PTL41132.1 formylglycine-generating enzyme family protein [Blastopirellula marina]